MIAFLSFSFFPGVFGLYILGKSIPYTGLSSTCTSSTVVVVVVVVVVVAVV